MADSRKYLLVSIQKNLVYELETNNISFSRRLCEFLMFTYLLWLTSVMTKAKGMIFE